MSLWREMNDVLNRLELMSDVAAPNPSPSGGGKPGSRVLSMTDVPPRDYWLGRWNRATDDRGRERALEGARDELASLTRRTTEADLKPESEYDRGKRINACDGWSPKEVQANIRGGVVTAREVRAHRWRRGVDPLTGYGLRDGTDPVQRLLEAGASVREVEELTQRSKSSVHRGTRRAA